jgi:hypothetical protein
MQEEKRNHVYHQLVIEIYKNYIHKAKTFSLVYIRPMKQSKDAGSGTLSFLKKNSGLVASCHTTSTPVKVTVCCKDRSRFCSLLYTYLLAAVRFSNQSHIGQVRCKKNYYKYCVIFMMKGRFYFIHYHFPLSA